MGLRDGFQANKALQSFNISPTLATNRKHQPLRPGTFVYVYQDDAISLFESNQNSNCVMILKLDYDPGATAFCRNRLASGCTFAACVKKRIHIIPVPLSTL